ncbi:MAG TPA: LLM class flavin-dependent oxidoreductase [Candidatus Binataceae bacterium]|nr:LLM class flavin-dependent oxidoreductase [Candidatus Binataceae bacterium]
MRKVKVGYQFDFRNPPNSGRSFQELYASCLTQAEACEGAGFDSIWLTEHHFTDDGYLPSMMPMAGAIAARTKRVTIGTYVLLAPFQHPLKLAEDTAVVDVISGGRLRLGVGQGYRQEEFDGFGINRAERLGRTLETVEILKLAWRGERFDFHGKYFHLHDVRVLPAPVSKPHPELLWGVGAPKAIQRAAKMDMSFACVGGRKEIGIYIDALKAAGKDPTRYNIVNSRVIYVADSEDKAWDDTRNALMYQAELYGKWLTAAQALGGGKGNVLIRPDPDRLRRTSILGPPSYIKERLAETLESTPMTELIVVMQLPGLDPKKARASLDRFCKEVLPEIREEK